MGVFLLDDLKMYWSCDDAASSTTITDDHNYLGTGIHDLDPVGTGVTAQTGKLNGCGIGTQNTSNYNATSGDHADYHPPTSGMTISAWAFVPTGTLTINHPILAHYNHTGNQESWLLYGKNTGDVFTLSVSTDGSTQAAEAVWGTPYSVDTWYYIAAFFDYGNGRVGISIDRGTTVWANVTFPLHDSTNALTHHFFQGSIGVAGGARIDEMGIWHRLLNSEELDALYNGGGTPPAYSTFTSATTSPSLIMYRRAAANKQKQSNSSIIQYATKRRT